MIKLKSFRINSTGDREQIEIMSELKTRKMFQSLEVLFYNLNFFFLFLDMHHLYKCI